MKPETIMMGLSIDLSKIDKSKIVNHENGGKYYNFTVSVSTESNDWGKNASAWESQTKEERENSKQRNFIGGGNVFWTSDGLKQLKASKKDSPSSLSLDPVEEVFDGEDDLPF